MNYTYNERRTAYEKTLHGRTRADFNFRGGNDRLRGVAEQKRRKSNCRAHGKSNNPAAGSKGSNARTSPENIS